MTLSGHQKQNYKTIKKWNVLSLVYDIDVNKIVQCGNLLDHRVTVHALHIVFATNSSISIRLRICRGIDRCETTEIETLGD